MTAYYAVFANALRGHFQELQLKNDSADFSQIWPDDRTIDKQQKHVGNSIIRKIISLRAISVRSLRICSCSFKQCSVTFERNLIKENPDTSFLSLSIPTFGKKTNFKNMKIALLGNSRKTICTFKFVWKTREFIFLQNNEIFE